MNTAKCYRFRITFTILSLIFVFGCSKAEKLTPPVFNEGVTNSESIEAQTCESKTYNSYNEEIYIINTKDTGLREVSGCEEKLLTASAAIPESVSFVLGLNLPDFSTSSLVQNLSQEGSSEILSAEEFRQFYEEGVQTYFNDFFRPLSVGYFDIQNIVGGAFPVSSYLERDDLPEHENVADESAFLVVEYAPMSANAFEQFKTNLMQGPVVNQVGGFLQSSPQQVTWTYRDEPVSGTLRVVIEMRDLEAVNDAENNDPGTIECLVNTRFISCSDQNFSHEFLKLAQGQLNSISGTPKDLVGCDVMKGFITPEFFEQAQSDEDIQDVANQIDGASEAMGMAALFKDLIMISGDFSSATTGSADDVWGYVRMVLSYGHNGRWMLRNTFEMTEEFVRDIIANGEGLVALFNNDDDDSNQGEQEPMICCGPDCDAQPVEGCGGDMGNQNDPCLGPDPKPVECFVDCSQGGC